MKQNNIYILPIIILILILSSCSITKTKKSTGINTQKNEQKFTYLFSEANKNRLLGNSQKAVEFYMSALDLKPKSAASNYYLATLFMSEKKYATALTFANNAVNLQENNLWYNLIKGDILNLQKNDNQAINVYKSLQKQFPTNEFLYDRIINIQLDKMDAARKNKDFSTNKEALNNLIYIYNEKQKHFGFDKKIAEYLYNIYVELNDKNSAITTLKDLIKHEPSEPKYQAFLAENYVKSKNYKEADKLYFNLLATYPNNNFVKISYSKYCKFTGKHKEYFTTVKELLKSNLEFNKKINLISSGGYPNFPPKQYEELLNILYKNHSNEIISNTLFTEFYIEKNKQKALPYLIKATELGNDNFNLILTLFEVAYDSKNFEILYNQSKKYIELYPNRPKVFLYNGIGAYKTKRYNEAITILDMGKDFVIEDNKLLLQFHFYLAETYHSQENHKNSDKHFDKVLKINSKFYLALNNYSYYLAVRKHNLQKALLMSENCISHNSQNPVFCNTYAKVLLENKQYKKALIYSEKAINIIKKNIEFLENYGDILFSNNKKEEALKNWKLSKDYGNKTDKINYKIENINKLKIEDL